MTNPARYQPLAPAAGTRINLASQATAIEQSRAIAEVQAAVLVAQQHPRSKSLALDEMRDATAQTAVAESAFFRYSRGDGAVTGVSIHLARELARCWGNIDYGIKELSRDDDKGSSEMLAYAWDMERNSRPSTTFIVPHTRDTRSGTRQLTDTRDIYENNANNGARRLREQILAVLPKWFVEEAKDRCRETLKRGNGDPLEQRRANAIQGFAGIGVVLAQLEAKLGATQAEWTGEHLGHLAVIFKSIQSGEMNVADEFPAVNTAAETSVPAAEITAAGRKKRAPRRPAAEAKQGAEKDAGEASESGEKPDTAQVDGVDPKAHLGALLDEVGLAAGTAERTEVLTHRAGRDVTDVEQLTDVEAEQIAAAIADEIAGPPAGATDETTGGAQ